MNKIKKLFNGRENNKKETNETLSKIALIFSIFCLQQINLNRLFSHDYFYLMVNFTRTKTNIVGILFHEKS